MVVEGSVVKFQSNRGQGSLLLVLGLLTALYFSCSGTPRDADTVIDRMVDAYGGPEKLERLESFTGKGFIKDPLGQSVIRYYPYDHYQRDTLVKTKVVLLEKGEPYNIKYATFDGLNLRSVDKNNDRFYQPMTEFVMIDYRFPLVFDWLQSTELEGMLTDDGEESGMCRIEYVDTFNVIEVGIDREEWLLRYVRFEDRSDSLRSYIETYSDYWKVEGIPFPSRFTAKLRDVRPYYEYYFTKIEIDADLPDSTFILSPEELAQVPPKGTSPVERE